MPKKSHSMNVMLTPEQRARLGELADASGLSMGQVVRNALDAAHAHVVLQTPMCPDGRRCMAPHLLPPTPPTPTQAIIPNGAPPG